ncbi:MAG: GNAT family N-acetyltransferase [Rhizobiaceae bacterium]
MLAIKLETPLQPDVRNMIAALNAYLRPLSPPEFQFQMTADEMAEPQTSLFIARNDTGQAVAMGALKIHDNSLAEVKRMFVDPELRATGAGYEILKAVEALAREKGMKILKLETGNTPGFESAWQVYERNGFSQCPAFLDYPESNWSRFYEKKLN